MVCNSDESAEMEQEALESLRHLQIAGLIFAPIAPPRDTIRSLAAQGTAIVYIDNEPPFGGEYDSVSIDNALTSHMLTHEVLKREQVPSLCKQYAIKTESGVSIIIQYGRLDLSQEICLRYDNGL